jgi:APA family basic amino acid/polyamine antiporter
VAGYLFGWTLATVIQPGSIAAVSMAFGKYLSALIPMEGNSILVVASLAIAMLTGINYLGVKKGAVLGDFLSSLKIIALLILAGVGLFSSPSEGVTAALQEAPASFEGWSAFGVALIAAFWAFDGWNNGTYMAGEVKDPQRNIPLALVSGILSVAALYILVSLGMFRVLSTSEIQNSPFVAADVARRVFQADWAAQALSAVVVLSTLGCVNGMVLAGARVSYAMAEDRKLPRFFGKVSPAFDTPSGALLVQMLWSIVLLWSGSFDQLFTYVISASFIFYGLTGLSLVVLRKRHPEVERPFRVPLYPAVPLAYFALCAAFVFNTFVEKPTESLIGLGIVLLGLPVYLWVSKKR